MNKGNNKKYVYFGLLFLLVILVISIVIKILLKSKIDIESVNKDWKSYDLSIENIKNNLDPITENNENFYWWKLKDFDIEDKEYEQMLNSLVANVRMCYLYFTDNGELYTNSNPIRKFREKDYITYEELERLNDFMYVDTKYCLNRFEQYNDTILISSDGYSKNKFLNEINKINVIKETKLFSNKEANYNELLLRKIMEVHLIEDLSEFIKEEYIRLRE